MANHPTLAIEARGLGKQYDGRWVLQDLDLDVARGSVIGLLGPNGAGKTTTVRLLTTLLRPDAGTARVAGADIATDPDAVRRRIGVAGQSATVDELLSGRANLEMIGRLYQFGRAASRSRAEGLLGQFDLSDAGDRLVKTYSGGMRRRLDLAASLVASPPVLFLDEPTTGLDPHSRNGLWDILRDLVAQGTTLLLTTQYLEEADRLCDEIVVIDHGRAVGSGSPEQLKAQVGDSHLVVTFEPDADLAAAAELLQGIGTSEPSIDREGRQIAVAVGSEVTVPGVVRSLDAAGIDSHDVAVQRGTLDDVFLALTGAPATDQTHHQPEDDDEEAA